VTRCISAVINGQDDLRQDLRQLWATLLAITYQHQTLVLGRPSGPQCSAMPMTSEPMQTDQSHTIDTRTIEERIADAKRTHRHWWRIIESLPVPNMIWAIRSALGGGIGGLGAEVWQGEQPTRRGLLLVNALLLLHRAVK
jgi:hypothetical protein